VRWIAEFLVVFVALQACLVAAFSFFTVSLLEMGAGGVAPWVVLAALVWGGLAIVSAGVVVVHRRLVRGGGGGGAG
jgi:hypothetical protein